ncbi:MAG: hypothetical protein MN733_10870 [Nitrososphaera sp.]|nr:hypothetical protein [Nitrososphaera sp.]
MNMKLATIVSTILYLLLLSCSDFWPLEKKWSGGKWSSNTNVSIKFAVDATGKKVTSIKAKIVIRGKGFNQYLIPGEYEIHNGKFKVSDERIELRGEFVTSTEARGELWILKKEQATLVPPSTPIRASGRDGGEWVARFTLSEQSSPEEPCGYLCTSNPQSEICFESEPIKTTDKVMAIGYVIGYPGLLITRTAGIITGLGTLLVGRAIRSLSKKDSATKFYCGGVFDNHRYFSSMEEWLRYDYAREGFSPSELTKIVQEEIESHQRAAGSGIIDFGFGAAIAFLCKVVYLTFRRSPTAEEQFNREAEDRLVNGIKLEARGQYEEALAIYDDILLNFSDSDAAKDAGIRMSNLRRELER